jgi:hypothetical protein
VTFIIPNGLNADTETQTAVSQLLEFQASHSIYNIDSSNNKLEIFVQLYDTTRLSLSKTNTSTIITISLENYSSGTTTLASLMKLLKKRLVRRI